jgi:hypothetical protein
LESHPAQKVDLFGIPPCTKNPKEGKADDLKNLFDRRGRISRYLINSYKQYYLLPAVCCDNIIIFIINNDVVSMTTTTTTMMATLKDIMFYI